MSLEQIRTLKSDRVLLSPLVEEDAKAITEALSQEKMSLYLDFAGPGYTIEQAVQFISEFAPAQWDEGDPLWAVRPLTDGEAGPLAGLITLRAQGPGSKDIGFWIAPDQWNAGFATEAATLALGAAFNTLDTKRIVHLTDVYNHASQSVARKLGFQPEGTIRIDAGDGSQKRLLQSAILASDWADITRSGDRSASSAARVDPKVLLGSQPQELVSEFHRVYGMPNLVEDGDPPTLDIDRLAMRMALIKEEMVELTIAVYGSQAGHQLQAAFSTLPDDNSRDLVETADALADLVYVIYGMALETGIDLDAVLAEVQSSNLSKLDVDGSVIRREDGKILKGPNFNEPRIAEVLTQP